MRKFIQVMLPLSLLIVMVFSIPAVFGQGETIITLATPGWMGDVFDANLFGPFEAEHPGVKVVVVPQDNNSFYPPAAYGLEEHLEGTQKFAASADVLSVANWNFSVEATRAGYFLDLTPLVQSDATLDTADFFPAVWRSFQWDGGIWALPLTASVQIITYNIEAFDNAGLSYPNENWTLDDLANAARALTVKDAEGNVEIPGLEFYNVGLLTNSLLGETFYDSTIIPNPPKFSSPNLATILESWAQLQADMRVTASYDYDKVPMTMGQPWRLMGGNPEDAGKWGAALLPGGKAGLDVQGFAVSRGTLNPELAYALAKYLTGSAEVVSRYFGNTPARRSLVGVETEDDFIVFPEIDSEVQAILDKAIENAIPSSELRYSEYINLALNKMMEGDVDAATALQEVEAEAIKNLETAAAQRETTTVMVATPIPTPSFGANQIVLKFGLNLFISPLPDRDQWDLLVQEFLAQNPAIGNIDLMEQMYQPEDMDKLDCYYQPYNSIQDAPLEDYLNLDPFMDADPNFDADDFMRGVLEQVQRDNLTWAYPITVQPGVLWYNGQMFNDAGLPSPERGWTIEGFNEALRLLKDRDERGRAPFAPQTFGNTYLLILMAAYNALPYDFRTNPPTINFTDPQNVTGVQQVLDLAKNGLLDYEELATNSGGTIGPGDQAIFSDTLSNGNWRLQNREMMAESEYQDPYRLTNYPSGSQYVPVSFSIGAAYIRSNAQNPEACYRWISMIAQRPDLFQAMPARYSLMSDPSLAIAQGDDIVALYEGFVDKLRQPNIVVFPGDGSGGGFNGYIEQMWLNRAFDNYVLENGNLALDLADAQQLVEGYRGCADNIPPYDAAIMNDQELALAYYRQYTDCAIQLDPTLKEMFSFYYEESE